MYDSVLMKEGRMKVRQKEIGQEDRIKRDERREKGKRKRSGEGGRFGSKKWMKRMKGRKEAGKNKRFEIGGRDVRSAQNED